MQSVSYDRKTLLLNSLSFVIFQALKLDLDYKGEKIIALSKELEELQIGGGASEEELNSVKRQKTDLEMRLKEQVSFDSINNFIHTTTSGVLKVGYKGGPGQLTVLFDGVQPSVPHLTVSLHLCSS